MKKTKNFPIAILVLTILTGLFIWSNSLPEIDQSKVISLKFLEKIKPFLEIFIGAGNVTDHLVRKLAHFAEFALLGCELAWFLIAKKICGIQEIINCLFVALLVAISDETIQIFTGRGSQVQDVWLDLFGATFGLLIVTVLWRIIKKERE